MTNKNTHDHWYEVPAGPELRQGDILRDVFVIWFPQETTIDPPPTDKSQFTVVPEWQKGDWIVMSASCDLDRSADDYPHALLGRVVQATIGTFGVTTDKEFRQRCEVIRKGLEPSKFLLPEHPNAQPPFLLSTVLYRQHVTMPADYIRRECGGRRLRLKHPFRESFGAWVGANIGRVGPETHTLIPEFVKTYPAHVLKANEE